MYEALKFVAFHVRGAIRDMSLRIFISYGHDEHADLARKLQLELQQRGHDVWFDETKIRVGTTGRQPLKRA